MILEWLSDRNSTYVLWIRNKLPDSILIVIANMLPKLKGKSMYEFIRSDTRDVMKYSSELMYTLKDNNDSWYCDCQLSYYDIYAYVNYSIVNNINNIENKCKNGLSKFILNKVNKCCLDSMFKTLRIKCMDKCHMNTYKDKDISIINKILKANNIKTYMTLTEFKKWLCETYNEYKEMDQNLKEINYHIIQYKEIADDMLFIKRLDAIIELIPKLLRDIDRKIIKFLKSYSLKYFDVCIPYYNEIKTSIYDSYSNKIIYYGKNTRYKWILIYTHMLNEIIPKIGEIYAHAVNNKN